MPMKTQPIFHFILPFLLMTGCQSEQSRQQEYQQAYQRQAAQLTQKIVNIEPDSTRIQTKAAANFNLRKPQFIVLHHTEQDNCQQTYDTFQKPEYEVSAHYVICKDGQITQMLSDYVRGWHAGKGKWYGINDMNSLSLGIELDNNGQEPFSERQIAALLGLLADLSDKYDISPENIIAHADWAVGRKVDPSVYFPWRRLAQAGYGRWYDEHLLATTFPPADFDPIHGLRNLGYDTTHPEDAVKSFRIHYMSTYKEQEPLSKKERQIIYLLGR